VTMMDLVDSPAGKRVIELSDSSSEESEDDENILEQYVSEDGDAPFCGCYLVRSTLSQHRYSIYIGFTVNPLRRIRQHNGEIQGGARKTRSKRPWCFVALVNGFRSQVEALQFEWAWQHPKKSKIVREAIAVEGPTKKRAGWQGQLDILATMLSIEKWRSLEVRIADVIATPIPSRLATYSKLTIGAITAWEPACMAAESGVAPIALRATKNPDKPDAQKCQENKHIKGQKKRKKDLFVDPMACALCGGEGGDFHVCRQCKAAAHVSCLGNAFAAVSVRGGRSQGTCPFCAKQIILKNTLQQISMATPHASHVEQVHVLDLSEDTPVIPASPSDGTLDLCSPSPAVDSDNIDRDPIQNNITPAAMLTFNENDDDESDSIIDLTRTVRKSFGFSSPIKSASHHRSHRPSFGSFAPTGEERVLFFGDDEEKNSDDDDVQILSY